MPDSERRTYPTLSEIRIEGFKSFAREERIKLGSLTVLAGENSSGKSSALQPLLLIKQTLEASYDPGPFLFNGPHLQVTRAKNLLWQGKIESEMHDEFAIGATVDGRSCRQVYHLQSEHGLIPSRVDARSSARAPWQSITQESTEEELSHLIPQSTFKMIRAVAKDALETATGEPVSEGAHLFRVQRDRCVLRPEFAFRLGDIVTPWFPVMPVAQTATIRFCQRMIHIPGLRGLTDISTRASYPDDKVAGRFENYVATIIRQWQQQRDPRAAQLHRYLANLGLAGSVTATKLDDTSLQLKVSTRKRASRDDDDTLIPIGMAGKGVGHCLPVLVGLLCANERQPVLIEQPELHLHPNAVHKLGKIICREVGKGKFVIIETHSSLLLRCIQTEIAADRLDRELVALNWFTRRKDGSTVVKSAGIHDDGSYGRWPVDFDNVSLHAESEYLDAVSKRFAAGDLR